MTRSLNPFVIYFNPSQKVTLCESVQFGHLYRNLHNKIRRNSTRKSCIKFHMVLKKVSLDFSFSMEERPDLRTPLQQTNEQTPTTLKHAFEFTYYYFPCHLLTEQRYSSYINHRWKIIILDLRSLNVFEENIVVTIIKLEFVRKTSTVVFFFKFVHVLSCLMLSLIDICQIVTDSWEKNFSKFVWKPFKSPLSLRK